MEKLLTPAALRLKPELKVGLLELNDQVVELKGDAHG